MCNEQKWDHYRGWSEIDEKERHEDSSQSHGNTKKDHDSMGKI